MYVFLFSARSHVEDMAQRVPCGKYFGKNITVHKTAKLPTDNFGLFVSGQQLFLIKYKNLLFPF